MRTSYAYAGRLWLCVHPRPTKSRTQADDHADAIAAAKEHHKERKHEAAEERREKAECCLCLSVYSWGVPRHRVDSVLALVLPMRLALQKGECTRTQIPVDYYSQLR